MNLIQRVQDILLKPKATWPVIDAEPADAASLYKNYVLILALIPAVAGFIGMSLIGIGAFGFSMRVPILAGLSSMVVGYAMSAAMVFVLALIIDALAPTFEGTQNRISALKLSAYASTAAFVGGIFSLLPPLSMLGVLAAFYGVYLLYLGLPVLMKCPVDKAVAYTAVVVVSAIVGGLVISTVTALFTASPLMRLGADASSGSTVSIKGPNGEISLDTSKMEEMARKMEAAGKKMEKAQAEGDTAAAGKAAADVLGALTGTGGAPIPSQVLKPLLPETVGGMARESIEAQSGSVVGIGGSQASATYRDGDRRIQLTISDMGGLGGLMSVATWANLTLDRETDGQIEKVYKQGARSVHEDYSKDNSRGEYSLILGNGVMVEGRGNGVDIGALRDAVTGLDLRKLEAMQREQAAKS